MDSANQIQSLVDQVEKNPEYKISKQEAKGFLSEIKRLTQEDKTNMPPLVVIIMAYINMLFPELDELRAEAKAQK
jgi:polyhydroxyalkanoate synthesis regulator phasin|tara:strand:+ start:481 stop:705 length:225 start_codon:yes stop_codon:yes gene_type:complete